MRPAAWHHQSRSVQLETDSLPKSKALCRKPCQSAAFFVWSATWGREGFFEPSSRKNDIRENQMTCSPANGKPLYIQNPCHRWDLHPGLSCNSQLKQSYPNLNSIPNLNPNLGETLCGCCSILLLWVGKKSQDLWCKGFFRRSLQLGLVQCCCWFWGVFSLALTKHSRIYKALETHDNPVKWCGGNC